MTVLGRLSGAFSDRSVLAAATAASRLSRTFAILLRRCLVDLPNLFVKPVNERPGLLFGFFARQIDQ